MHQSDRWRAMLEFGAVEAVGHEIDPQLLQISYRKGQEEELETEVVYQDAAGATEQPRLLVSLKAVSALKLLCEHEHARCDKVSRMLAECRSAYYKELRWLRDQLYMAYESEEDAQTRRNLLTPDDFEVYWFEPEKFLDEDTRDFLIRCIRETNRRLLDENRHLKSTLQEMNLFEKASLPTVLKRLKLKHAAAQIMIELYNLLRTRAEMKKFKEAACELIGMAMPAPGTDGAEKAERAECTSGPSPPAEGAEAVTSPEDLRIKVQQQEAELQELRSRLSSAIDACLEREKAAEEHERAERLQQRVLDLERERNAERGALAEALRELRELRELQPELERVKGRMVRSVHKISESLQGLGELEGEKARSARTRRALSCADWGSCEEDDAESVAGSFRAALSRLDSLVVALPSTVQDVAEEMQQLKQRFDRCELETTSMAPTADPEEPLSVGEVEHSPAASCTGTHETLSVRTEAPLASRDGEAESSEARVSPSASESRSRHADRAAEPSEHDEHSAEHAAKLSQQVEGLEIKLELANQKIRALKEQLLRQQRRLPEGENAENLPGDKEDAAEIPDFMLPYQLLAKRKLPRWMILSQDAALKRKKREYLEKAENKSVGSLGKEVFAAFDFLVTAADAADGVQPERQAGRLPSPSPSARRSSAEVAVFGSRLQRLHSTASAASAASADPASPHSQNLPCLQRPPRTASPVEITHPWQPWEASRLPRRERVDRSVDTNVDRMDRADMHRDFQGSRATCIQGNAIFSKTANAASFTSPKESKFESQAYANYANYGQAKTQDIQPVQPVPRNAQVPFQDLQKESLTRSHIFHIFRFLAYMAATR
ncbi:unnamed protein product [Symbiodinium natans]|uniref:Uncharacterized protein n=1 Tax=Symbiodinium natans TaxID=878477 RepID=A0A812LE77_9DINO|nr:unnamed protein product [Symbiodinium natans]